MAAKVIEALDPCALKLTAPVAVASKVRLPVKASVLAPVAVVLMVPEAPPEKVMLPVPVIVSPDVL